MHNKRIWTVFLCTGALITAGIGGNYLPALSTTMCSETELAGMSYTLEQYVDSQSAGAASNPEAIVAFADEPAATDAAAPETDPNAASGAAIDPAAPTPEPAAEPTATPKPKSEYENIGISVAADYVNVRKKPNTDSKVVGKLYRGSAARIVKRVGDWVKIKSGQVEGYIMADYLAIGYSAEKMVDKFGTKIATVNTETLKVREAKNTDCAVLTLVSGEESFEVIREDKEWVKIMVDGDTKGFVSKEYVDITVKFKKAVSIEEEREAARKKAAAEAAAARAEQEAQQRQQQQASSNSGSSSSSSSSGSSGKSSGSGSSHKSSSGSSSSSHKSSSGSSGKSSSSSSSSGGNSSNGSGDVIGSGDGSAIASYALQFVGNPYVYGGTSLTNGTDCSGFTMSLYAKYGHSLPHNAAAQAGVTTKVSSPKPGDLFFYSNGSRINHVAMYIGSGLVIHASNPSDGIKISNAYYRHPVKIGRVMN